MVFWEEKRQSPRMKLRTPLRCQIRGRPEVVNAISDNISCGGLGFVNSNFIAPDSIMMLEFNLLSRVLRPTGRITRSSQLPRSDRYSLGIEFMELSRNDKDCLSDYVNMRTGTIL